MSTQRMRILIAYDGSRCSDAALHELWRAGLPQVADAVVFSVAESWLTPPTSTELADAAMLPGVGPMPQIMDTKNFTFALEAARDHAEFGARVVRNYFPDWKIESEVRRGSPASEILHFADTWKADLVVVGSHGRSAMGRFLMGSVSKRIVTEARCSVRISRSHSAEAYSAVRLLVGVDGSDSSLNAVCAIEARNWPNESEVCIVVVQDPIQPIAVTPPFPSMHPHNEEQAAEAQTWARNLVDQTAKGLREVGLETSSLIKIGDPRRILLDASEEWKADCIFMGARGLSKLDRLLLGSVSTAISTRAHCSVEVVRFREE